MRTCQSCGQENPDDRDFCSCGEYLRWEPTGFMPAITPEMAEQAGAQAGQQPPGDPQKPPAPIPAVPPSGVNPTRSAPAVPPPPPPPPGTPPGARVTPATPPEPAPRETGNGHGNGVPARTSSLPAIPAAPPPPPAQVGPPTAKTLVRNAAPKPPSAPTTPHEGATVVLRLPDGDPAKGETLHQGVEPGQRERVLALVRNQSGIVDNYDLAIDGLPDDWYSIFPSTVYLVPFGSGGTYEQEVEVHLHPPRSPEAEARIWDLRVVALSKAERREATSAPLALHITPYVETATLLRPQRKKGRRKADFDIIVTNKANAPVLLGLEGSDPDGELKFGFNRPPQELPPGSAVTTKMRVRPPKQIWVGRPVDHRLEVLTITGDEAAERAAAEPQAMEVLTQQPAGKKRWWKRSQNVPGVYAPRVFKPQIFPPDATIGPGGIQLRKPQFRAPQLQAPKMKSFQASEVKLPHKRSGSPAAPAAALLPTQGVFRQKSWLPWWLIPLLALLILLAVLVYTTLLPKNVKVPNVVGQKSSFAAEQALTQAKLKLDPNSKAQIADDKPAGSVLKQTPAAGATVNKGSQVAILVAVHSGKVNVPNIVGMTAAQADETLRQKGLTLGQASPQPLDPKAKISSQIPSANEPVKQGTPVNIFYPVAKPAASATPGKKGGKGSKNGSAANAAAGAGAAGAAAGAAAGGSGAASIVVPAIGKSTLDAYAKQVSTMALVPVEVKEFNDAPSGTLVTTDPPPGTKAKSGQKLKLLVSVGEPEILISNGSDVLEVNGSTGKSTAVANGPQDETNPTWSADGTHVAYTADGRIFLKDVTKKNAQALALTPAGDEYENLAWAPTADVNLIAMDKVSSDGKDSDLCLGKITNQPISIQCFDEPSFQITRSIHWAPDGRSILAFGVKNDTSAGVIFGIVRWKVKSGKPAFSSDRADWGNGHFVSDVSTPGKGMIDAAISPDGKQMAVISNQGASRFQLWLVPVGDFLLTSGKPSPVRACKVAWRGDSKALAVIEADAGCTEEVGGLFRMDVDDLKDGRQLRPAANDPEFQPFNLGG